MDKPIDDLLGEGGLVQWVHRMAKYTDFLNGRLRVKPDPVWIPVTFQNSWVDYDVPATNPFYPTSYAVDPFGYVMLRGVIKNGTVTSAAFTLPPALRPLKLLGFASVANNAIGRIDITAGGTVVPMVGSNAFYFLDGIKFSPGI